jgi:replicative DNA helicase
MIELHDSAPALRTASAVLADLERGALGSTSISTGFYPLDEALGGGLRTRHLNVVGGLPGSGKSSLTLQMARNMALEGTPIVYASYEHDRISLLERLLLMEIGELVEGSVGASKLARMSLRGVVSGEKSLDEELAGNLLLRAAHAKLEEYSDLVFLMRASPVDTAIDQLDESAHEAGPGSILFVDFLQKIPVEERTSDLERITQAASGLKEIALRREVAVVSIVAGDQPGMSVRRLRLPHLRGAAGLAYEADVVLMMNEKATAVSKLHSAFDPIRAETFKQYIVVSVDKNRDGEHGVDVEFKKDFAHLRIDPEGGYVEERLVDELMYPE